VRTLSQFFIIAVLGMYQHARSQVLGFGGQNKFLGVKDFCVFISLKQTVTWQVPVWKLRIAIYFCNSVVSFLCNVR